MENRPLSGQIVRSAGLGPARLDEVATLAEACSAAEGLAMRLNWGSLRRRPADQVNDLLFYEDGRLIGYFGLYHFGDPAEAEATAMTHPDYRRRGIFNRLLYEGKEVLRERRLSSLLFFADRRSKSVAAVVQATGMVYDHTEYLMYAERAAVRLAPPRTDLRLRLASVDDLPFLARLDEEGFGVPADRNGFLAPALRDLTQRVWVIERQGEAIGKIHGRCGDAENHIFGFVVAAPHRGQGYGKSGLSEAMRRLRAERDQRFSLEVMTENEHALGLYQAHGFSASTAYDYYRLRC